MNIYINIIKILLYNKDIYNKYYRYIDLMYLKENYPELWRVFLVLPKIYDVIKEGHNVQLVDLALAYETAYPNADKNLFAAILAQIEKAEADPTLVTEYLQSAASRQAASQLAFIALDYAEGKGSAEKLKNAQDEYNHLKPVETSLKEHKFVSDDIEELYNVAIKEPGLSWRLQSLRRSLGPLRKGDFGFIFARPETGKTTFLASEVTYMAEQTNGRPILWVNNEERGEKVAIRLYQSSLGATLEQILANKLKAKEAYHKRTRRSIKIEDDATLSRGGVEELCRILEPALIVVDQLDKVKGFEADREDLMLGDIYIWARELAKEYAPVIGVSQSDGSGEGQKWLNMGNVSNAKTAKQAEADWILGIGVDYNDAPNVRGFSVCKNKLIGGEESVPAQRHGKWETLIQPEIGRYEDIARG